MQISTENKGYLGQVEQNRLRNDLFKSTSLGALNSIPKHDFVLSNSLLNKISENQMISPKVVRDYKERMKEFEVPEVDLLGEPERESSNHFVDEVIAKGQKAIERLQKEQEEFQEPVEIREATDKEREVFDVIA